MPCSASRDNICLAAHSATCILYMYLICTVVIHVHVPLFLPTGVPLVIEGATEHWAARHWSLDSLKQRVGTNEVFVRTNTNCSDYKVPVHMYLAWRATPDLFEYPWAYKVYAYVHTSTCTWKMRKLVLVRVNVVCKCVFTCVLRCSLVQSTRYARRRLASTLTIWWRTTSARETRTWPCRTWGKPCRSYRCDVFTMLSFLLVCSVHVLYTWHHTVFWLLLYASAHHILQSYMYIYCHALF